MVQGLIFEVPVMFMLRRELAVAADVPPAWLLRVDSVHAHWLATYAAFALGRGPATCLWIFSLFPGYGANQLRAALGPEARFVYHLLAVFFTSLNLRIIGLFMCWHEKDAQRARDFEAKARLGEVADCGATTLGSTGSNNVAMATPHNKLEEGIAEKGDAVRISKE